MKMLLGAPHLILTSSFWQDWFSDRRAMQKRAQDRNGDKQRHWTHDIMSAGPGERLREGDQAAIKKAKGEAAFLVPGQERKDICKFEPRNSNLMPILNDYEHEQPHVVHHPSILSPPEVKISSAPPERLPAVRQQHPLDLQQPQQLQQLQNIQQEVMLDYRRKLAASTQRIAKGGTHAQGTPIHQAQSIPPQNSQMPPEIQRPPIEPSGQLMSEQAQEMILDYRRKLAASTQRIAKGGTRAQGSPGNHAQSMPPQV